MPEPSLRPHELLGARHDHPDQTGPVISSEPAPGLAPDTPNPGSDEALDRGCLCAVLDNCHGRFPPVPPDGWYITWDCPVHAPVSKEGEHA